MPVVIPETPQVAVSVIRGILDTLKISREEYFRLLEQ